jgi:putative membrane protein
MMHDWWGSGGWGGWITIMLAMVFLAVIIIGVVLLVLGISRGRTDTGQGPAPPTTGPEGDARDVVRRRYAAGEIEREEYLQKLRDLDG